MSTRRPHVRVRMWEAPSYTACCYDLAFCWALASDHHPLYAPNAVVEFSTLIVSQEGAVLWPGATYGEAFYCVRVPGVSDNH